MGLHLNVSKCELITDKGISDNDNDNDNDKRMGLTAKADQPDHKNNTVH